jgi:hypothetical protein
VFGDPLRIFGHPQHRSLRGAAASSSPASLLSFGRTAGIQNSGSPVVLASSMRQLLPWTVLSVEGLRQPDGELVGDEVGAGLAAIRAMLIEDDGAGPVFSACRSGSVFIG